MKDPNKANDQRIAELQRAEAGHKWGDLRTQEALRYAESIIETVREPLVVLDAGRKVLSANRSFYATFKVTPAETLRHVIYELGNGQWDIPQLRALLEGILSEKESFEGFEVVHDFKDIGRKIMLLNARRINRKTMDTQTVLLAIEDITERKMLESSLKESEELYRRIYETASDGIILLEKSEGKIAHANQAFEELSGYSREETIGKRFQDVGVLPDLGDFQRILQALDESGAIHYKDVRVRTKAGRDIDTDLYLVDKTRLVQCNMRDITERKKAEEKQAESEAKYRSIFENAIEGIFQTTPDGRFITANPALARMYGYGSPREMLEANTDMEEQLYIDPQDRIRLKALYREQGYIRSYEVRLYTRDKRQIWVSMNARALKDEEGKILYYEGTAEDITSRKIAEEKLKQTTEKLRKALGGTIQAISLTVESRDPYTAGHQRRVSSLARAIAQEMALPDDTVDAVRMAGAIHDIGKMSVPAEILSKPGRLSDIEMSLIRTHSQTGYDILKDVELPYPVARTVLEHHERMDGSGYPGGLKGEEFIMEARILAVADVVEAMASTRPYRGALGVDAALEEIERNAGVLYDKEVAAACLELFRNKGFTFD